MGLLLPLLPPFLFPLHVKYCEEIALALFKLCCLKCTVQHSPNSHCRCLPHHTVSFQITRSAHHDCTPPKPGSIVKILPWILITIVALHPFGMMKSASWQATFGLLPIKRYMLRLFKYTVLVCLFTLPLLLLYMLCSEGKSYICIITVLFCTFKKGCQPGLLFKKRIYIYMYVCSVWLSKDGIVYREDTAFHLRWASFLVFHSKHSC